MAEFVVEGPCEVVVIEHRIKEEETRKKCQNLKRFDRKGVYVFACQNGEPLPIYVGQTSKGGKSIYDEAFSYRNKYNLNEYLSKNKVCGLALFSVTRAEARGRIASNKIREIEAFLIAAAARRNKALINIQGTSKKDWTIREVYPAGSNPRSSTADEFRKMLGLK